MRTIFNHAGETDILKRNPFKQVKIKTKSPRKERLTIDHVKKIKVLEFNGVYPTSTIPQLISINKNTGSYNQIVVL